MQRITRSMFSRTVPSFKMTDPGFVEFVEFGEGRVKEETSATRFIEGSTYSTGRS